MDTSETNASTLHLLHRARQIADVLLTEALGYLDLTPRQFIVLAAVSSGHQLTQSQLTDLTGVDRSTMADLVARLAERGLLRRTRSSLDRRADAVSLTAKGVQILQIARPAAAQVDTQLLSHLPTAWRERFVDNLAAILDNCPTYQRGPGCPLGSR